MLELTFHFGLEAQALIDVGADAVQARAELCVALLLVCPAGLVARIELVAAVGHGGDPHIKLSEQRPREREREQRAEMVPEPHLVDRDKPI